MHPPPHPPDSATGWRRAHLLHDVDMHRKAKAWKLHQRLKQRTLKRQASGPTNGKVWGGTVALQDDLPPYDREHEYDPPLAVLAVVHNLTVAADSAVGEECTHLGITNRG